MRKILILLLSVAAHASAQSTVPLVAYKKRESGTEVYQYTVGSYGPAPRDFTIVNGRNKEDGDFSYVKVFEYAQYPRSQYDSFDRRIDICKVRFSNGLTTHLLSSSGCSEKFVPEQVRDSVTSVTEDDSFYASAKKPRRQGVEVFLNQCRDRSNTVYFTKLTTGRASCPSGSNREYTESFWAHSTGGLACPPKEETIDNGHTTQTDFTDRVFPNQLDLKCNSGYKVEGIKSVNCEGGRWSGELGRCSKISCGQPGHLDNGNIRGSDFSYKGSIEYICNEGYKLDRPYSQRRECMFNGQWNPSEEPNCETIICKSPAVTSNVEIEGTDYSFGKSIRFRCRDGYNPQGSPIATCNANGWDTEAPSCSAKACNNPGTPDNGKRQGDNFNVYSTMTFSCNNGYQLMPPDSETIICLPTTRWNRPSPICERITCSPLAQPRNGQHDGNAPSKFASGSVVLFKCHEGYKIDGAYILRCQLNSFNNETASWSNEAPLCQPIVCKSPAVTSNVEIEGTDYSFGKSIRFRCRAGYNLQGSPIATCNANGWDTEAPSCSAVKCPDLPRLENGRLSTELFQCGYPGQNITFECFPGYYLQGNQEITCQANGQWNKDMPQCIPCPRNRYKQGMNQDTCKPCPVRSITLSVATTSIDHCMCEEGSSKQDDGTCVAITRCNDLVCFNNASCISNFNGTRCICAQGWEGVQCTIQSGALPRACNSNPCENGASCFSSPSRFYCLCPPGFSGQTCASQVCKPNPCQNGGQCIAFGSFALCSCSGRHVGRNCEISI